jgi:hypothetical protein
MNTTTATAVEHDDPRWARVRATAPVLAATCRFYVDQIVVSARPATVGAVDRNLLYIAQWLIDHDPAVVAFRQIKRAHI